jgi:hypothetical protein
VRGQDRQRVEGGEPLPAAVGEQLEGAGVEDQGMLLAQHLVQQAAAEIVGRQAAAGEHRPDAIVADPVERPAGCLDDAERHGRAIFLGLEPDRARPRSRRGGGGQRAGARHLARHDGDQAAGILVVVGTRTAQLRALDRLEAAVHRHADVGDDDAAHVPSRRLQEVSRLQRAEGDGEVECGDGGQDRAIIGGDAARQVDRHAQPRLGGHAGEDALDGLVQAAGEAGAEQGVDQQRSGGGFSERYDVAAPSPPDGLCCRRTGLAKRRDVDAATAPSQLARDDVAVAAIVTGAAQDERVRRAGEAPDRLRGGNAGTLHQQLRGRAGGDDAGFGRPHLVGRQDRPADH